MNWLEYLNEAIQYIEDHLTEEIDYARLGQLARCSAYHFQRMFSYMAGMPLSLYIRRRKMTQAALELQSGDSKIIDLALKYGYDSPTAFNRAFQSVHGIAPSGARQEGVKLKAYPPISFKLSIKGEAEMIFRIEQKEAFRIIGAKEHYTTGAEDAMSKIPQFWQRVFTNGQFSQFCTLMDGEAKGILGVGIGSGDMSFMDFDYYIAVASNQAAPAGMDEYTVPACTWAVFTCTGPLPGAIQDMQKRILTEWLPASGYEYANAPDIELYFEGDQQAEDYVSEIWLPIVKK